MGEETWSRQIACAFFLFLSTTVVVVVVQITKKNPNICATDS